MLLVAIPNEMKTNKKETKKTEQNIQEFARRWTRQLVHPSDTFAQCWQPRILIANTYIVGHVCGSWVTPEVGRTKIHFHSFYRYLLSLKTKIWINKQKQNKKMKNEAYLCTWFLTRITKPSDVFTVISGFLVETFVISHRFSLLLVW